MTSLLLDRHCTWDARQAGGPQRRPLALLWLLPLLLLLGLFSLAPLGWVLWHALWSPEGLTLARFESILASPFYRQAFGKSLWLASLSSLAGLLIAGVAAAALSRVTSRWRDAIIAFTNMSSNMAGVPLAFAFIVILGTNGAITLLARQWWGIELFDLYSMKGLLLLYIYFQLPLALLLLYPAFDNLQPQWQEAAALLGARPWQILRHITLPILAPALLGTFMLLFANAMGAYASAYALTLGNINLLTIRIASLVSGELFLEPELAAALCVLLLLILALVGWANQLLMGRFHYAAR
ncbi:MAG: ABC transporter permease subunit [Aeromonadaceae bacterium]|nr:ABC transporter permease subunit [Aeromonadaceae bacterium]